MDKPIAAIELGSKKLKLVVGYEIDGQVYVLYTLTKPYGNCIEGGNFIDANKVAETIVKKHQYNSFVHLLLLFLHLFSFFSLHHIKLKIPNNFW